MKPLDAQGDEVSQAADDEFLPAVPADLGQHLPDGLRTGIHQLLYIAAGQIGSVYRAMVAHPGLGPTDLLPYTDCANPGVVANRRVIVFALLNGVVPTSASVARQAARTVGTLLKATSDPAVSSHLTEVLGALEARANDALAVQKEDTQLQLDSAELELKLKQASGVYVYTYPHYWKYPYEAASDRRLLKVGRTSNMAWRRVLTQARQTGMPEYPLLLRVYEADNPERVERQFHLLLDAAEHLRSSGTAVGKEWFVSTVEFCDAIASVLGLVVHEGNTGSNSYRPADTTP